MNQALSKKGLADAQLTGISNYPLAEIFQPGVASLDLPAFAIASRIASILGRLANPASLVWHDQFDFALLSSFTPRITVVCFVTYHSPWLLARTVPPATVRDAGRCERGFRKFNFRRGRPIPVGFPKEDPGHRLPPSALPPCPAWFCRRQRPFFLQKQDCRR